MTTGTLAPTEQARIAQAFDYTARAENVFAPRPGAQAMLQARDLGLRAATGGLMRADHLRAIGAQDAGSAWHGEGFDFHYLYVLQGQVRMRTPEGAGVTLGPGDGAHVPGCHRLEAFAFTADFEAVEIAAPAQAALPGAQATAARAPSRSGRVDEFAVSYDGPQAYKVGDGPRRFLAYRDAAATAATGRRVNINIVRNSQAGDSSTGWHYHSLSCQFIFVLQGWSRVEVEGAGEFTIHAADSMTIPHGLKHDVTGFSADFAVLELNIPADYDTIACAPPARVAS